MTVYYRPILRSEFTRPNNAIGFANTGLWCHDVEVLSRTASPEIIPVRDVPQEVRSEWTRPRASIAGLDFSTPRIMGILNVTPDSFSDGGKFVDPKVAIDHAATMATQGADIIDIGGESTRPGATEVSIAEEIERIAPVIKAVCAAIDTPISIDTRKSSVAKAAVETGAQIVNDVSGLTFDPTLAEYCASSQVPICIMHTQGTPDVMQDNPSYEDVVLDVYDFLQTQMTILIAAGVPKNNIIVDPGIGFGKTLQHNLALLNRISLFHSLGVPVLLGASRKGMIRTIAGAEAAQDRMPGSVAIALNAVSQGVQLFRVHDVAETRQAFDLWQSILRGEPYGT